jgi:archaemetzincin
MSIVLIPFEGIEKEVLGRVKEKIIKTFRSEVEIYPKNLGIPSCKKRNNQLNAEDFIPTIRKVVESENKDYGLGITNEDLYVEELNFVFGIASGKACLISLSRLSSRNKELFLKRCVKEAIHELGHIIFKLEHCSDPRCVMVFSNSIWDVDKKSEDFCEKCKIKIRL